MPACFNDIEVLWISRFDYKHDWILSLHAHKDFYQLIYCIKGTCTVVINGEKIPVTAPVILFFQPRIKHGLMDINAKGLKTLDTKFLIHSRNLDAYCRKLPNIIKIDSDEIYYQLENIRSNGIDQNLLFQEKCQLLLGQIIIELIRKNNDDKKIIKPLAEYASEKSLSVPVAKMVKYIKDHYLEKLDVKNLEKSMFYSYRYLSKLFSKEMNMTPIQFIEKYKIFKAEELLKDSEFEIKYISEILGYQNVQDFSRSFKKNVGMPPNQWRDTTRLDICRDIIIHSGFTNTLFITKIPAEKNSSKFDKN